MLIDTHCHLHFKEFAADREAVIQRARDAGVKLLVNVGTDLVTNEAAHLLAGQHSGLFHTAGFHPHHSHEIAEHQWSVLEKFVAESKPVAIGEIGLDYFKSEASPEIQKKVFAQMLQIAMSHKLPVIVHSRNAFQDTVEVIRSETKGKIRGVMHCFSYDEASLKTLLELGFLASFTCNLTFKNATTLLDVACQVPLDRLMLETDSPYLAPQNYRGQRNEPAHLIWAARVLSEKRGISLEKLEEATSQTAIRFFGLDTAHA